MKLATAFLLLLALVVPGFAQKAAAPSEEPTGLEQQLLKELAKYEYKAKRDVPAADSIFVEKGKLQLPMYKLSLQQGGVLLKTGKTTKVSSVKIMDHGVQVFFETDKCALINMAADSEQVMSLPLQKLLDFTRTSIGALFEQVGGEQAPAEKKPAEEKKPPEEKK